MDSEPVGVPKSMLPTDPNKPWLLRIAPTKSRYPGIWRALAIVTGLVLSSLMPCVIEGSEGFSAALLLMVVVLIVHHCWLESQNVEFLTFTPGNAYITRRLTAGGKLISTETNWLKTSDIAKLRVTNPSPDVYEFLFTKEGGYTVYSGKIRILVKDQAHAVAKMVAKSLGTRLDFLG